MDIEEVLPNTKEEVSYELPTNVSCGTVREAMNDNNWNFQTGSEKLGLPVHVLTYHSRGECSCDTEAEPVPDHKKPWKEEEVLRQVLIEDNLHSTQAGEAFGCHKQTVKNWAKKFGIENRSSSSKLVRVNTDMGEEHKEVINEGIERDLKNRDSENPFE
jgi:hypothetical protein